VKRALEIAASGGHNIIFISLPGSDRNRPKADIFMKEKMSLLRRCKADFPY
jgi:hypothetical protein